MDDWAWEQLQPWLTARLEFPVGPLFCVIIGPTRGRRWLSAAARAQLRDTASAAGVRRRFAPHQLPGRCDRLLHRVAGERRVSRSGESHGRRDGIASARSHHKEWPGGAATPPARHRRLRAPMQREGSARRAYGSGSLFERNGDWCGKWRVDGRQVKRRIGPKRTRGEADGLTKAQAEAHLRVLIMELRAEHVRVSASAQRRPHHYTVAELGELFIGHARDHRGLRRRRSRTTPCTSAYTSRPSSVRRQSSASTRVASRPSLHTCERRWGRGVVVVSRCRRSRSATTSGPCRAAQVRRPKEVARGVADERHRPPDGNRGRSTGGVDLPGAT